MPRPTSVISAASRGASTTSTISRSSRADSAEEELTVAVLHHLDGYTQDGIAASLDLSRRTVGKMLEPSSRIT